MAVALADTILRRYPTADDYPFCSWSYPQGYLLVGLVKLWEVTGERRYYEYIREYCEYHVDAEGHLPRFTANSMDAMMTGAILVWMYQQTQEERYAKACHTIRATFDDYPRTREGGFLHARNLHPGEMWVDGVFMGQMFYIRYAKAFHEPGCWEETIRQLDLIYRYCHKHDGLLVHGYCEDNLAAWADEEGRSGEIWSEGLGWYALILAEALDYIPLGFAGRERAEGYYLELLAGLKKYQHAESGLWHQVVDKGDDPANWCDTSGSAMFTYAIKHAVDLGLVPAAEYLPVAQRAYEGLLTRVTADEQGLIDVHTACEGLCVQLRYEDYIDYPQKVNAQEAVCGYLWAFTLLEERQG